jgi:membrane-associated phospholipid phosphatase
VTLRLLRLTGAFLLVFGVTLALYKASGFTLMLPLFLATQILVVASPVGFGLVQLSRWTERWSKPRAGSLTAVLAGVALLVVWEYGGAVPVIVVALLALLVVRLATEPRSILTIALAMLSLITWLTAVQLANYVVLRLVAHRLRDEVLWGLDQAIYRLAFGDGPLDAIFPILRSPWAFQILENAYLTLAVQPMAVILLHRAAPGRICQFLLSGITCHGVALAFFFIFPTVGPTLYYPHLFDSAYADSLTGRAISSMLADLQAVQRGMQPVTGFGYFVALPSLHAAIATVCQLSARGRHLFWLLLPMNLVMLLSTFLLGQHYVVDAIGGVALGWIAWKGVSRMFSDR